MSAKPNGSAAAPPWLLLVGGAPGSGKTQLARQLATRYGAPLCTKDTLKEILFDTLGTAPPEPASEVARWSRRLSDASFALMFHVASLLLPAQRCVLLEGNFRPGEHEAPLAALLAGSGARLIQILCHARPATRAARLAARAGDPTRHPGHRDAHIDVQLPEPGFLVLRGLRLGFDSDAACDRALATLCRELDARLAPGRRQTPPQPSR